MNLEYYFLNLRARLWAYTGYEEFVADEWASLCISTVEDEVNAEVNYDGTRNSDGTIEVVFSVFPVQP